MAAEQAATDRPRNSALKDAYLKYRACTLDYAESLQLSSPTQLVGQTDFDFLSDRSAALVKAAELRVLDTGTTEITDGKILSKRTAGKYFVRSPVFNHNGQICGVEIFVVSVDELHKSYKLLLNGESQLGEVINQSPFGLLVHHDYEVVYLNETWGRLLGGNGAFPSAEELRRLVPDDIGSAPIRRVQAGGNEIEFRLQTMSVSWNARDAQAVYCFPVAASDQSNAITSSFIEKRHGHRRVASESAGRLSGEEQGELASTLARYKDYVSSAGDFFWEMDVDQRLTHVSMEMKDFLGIETHRILNVPLEQLTINYVHEDDLAEWKVLMVDLGKQLPFRNREYKWLHRDGERRVVRLSGVPVFDSEDKFCGYRGIGWDYTSQHLSASIVAYHASHDSLTGLVNRREFEIRCDEAVGRAADENQALCFIDLDKFKKVNDTAGHLAGDELLRQLSKLFTGFVRKSDVLARLGGDEFGLLIYDVGLNEARRLATQLCAEVDSFIFQWEGKQFSVGASIGLVMVDSRWDTRSSLFGAADAACYTAKSEGRNRVAVYDAHASEKESRYVDHQHNDHIEAAVRSGQIKLVMQQIASPEETEPDATRIEVLVRVLSPEGEMMLPGAVLPVVERAGLSVELDKAVIDSTMDWLNGQPHVTDRLQMCCINLSGAAIVDESFLNYLTALFEKAAIDTSILCFEISESAVSNNLSQAAVFMDKLGKFGCLFAMDNFSGGMNAFVCLKKLPVSYVKINGTFVKAILEDPVHYAMVKSINDVAQTLGKLTIAESVESDEIRAKLHELGVNLVQGYHISAPEIIDF